MFDGFRAWMRKKPDEGGGGQASRNALCGRIDACPEDMPRLRGPGLRTGKRKRRLACTGAETGSGKFTGCRPFAERLASGEPACSVQEPADRTLGEDLFSAACEEGSRG